MKKYCALFLLAGAMLPAADFQTGQAARAEIGQENFTRQIPGASERILGAASGLAVANDTLYVVDGNRVDATPQNNRILVYRNLSSTILAPNVPLPDTGERCQVCASTASTVLGQKKFSLTGINGTTATDSTGNPTGDAKAISAYGLRIPTAVASDGKRLVVADTDNNRVLIWTSIPQSDGSDANLVLGQGGFNSNTLNLGGTSRVPSQRGLRGPQGVWIQGDSLLVADTQNHRVLVWKNFPSSNGQPADVVLGQRDFTSYVEPDIAKTTLDPQANNLLNPVAVSADSQHVYVVDLGQNRVLVWNKPVSSLNTYDPADIAIGQPDMTSAIANNSSKLCASNGTDSTGAATYPERCSATINFPRFALSDGKRLFIADGGNDRVLVFNTIPTSSGAHADAILGQKDEFSNFAQTVDIFGSTEFNPDMVGANALRTPLGLAWDGTNLYVSDPYNRRILVFSAGDPLVSQTGVRNAASLEIFANGSVTVSGTATENDQATITIAGKAYTYKVVKDDSLANIVAGLSAAINADAGDPNVIARANLAFNTIVLASRKGGDTGNAIAYSVTTTPATSGGTAAVLLTASGGFLTGGQDAARLAPGALVTLLGQNFTDKEYRTPDDNSTRPKTLGGVEVYFDGIKAPLFYVSPTQINAQIPFIVSDTTNVTATVLTHTNGGTPTYAASVAVPIVPQNPGLFAQFGSEPRSAIALHESSVANGAIGVDGVPKEGDIVTVSIGADTAKVDYSYTVTKDSSGNVDSLDKIRDSLIALINADSRVRAEAAGYYDRIRLFAKDDSGNGLAYTASASSGATTIISAFGSNLCCASTAGAAITEDNPAIPGETITLYGAGLGLVNPDDASGAAIAGSPYNGPELNKVNSPVDVIIGGKTAQLLSAGLVPGLIGVYKIVVQLNTDIPTNPQTQATIAQDIYVSNTVTIPVKNPADSSQ